MGEVIDDAAPYAAPRAPWKALPARLPAETATISVCGVGVDVTLTDPGMEIALSLRDPAARVDDLAAFVQDLGPALSRLMQGR